MKDQHKLLTEKYHEGLKEREKKNLENALGLFIECEVMNVITKKLDLFFHIMVIKIDLYRRLKKYPECENTIVKLLLLFKRIEANKSGTTKLKEYWIIKVSVLREATLYFRDIGKYKIANEYILLAIKIAEDYQILSKDILIPLLETIADIHINLGNYDLGILQLTKILEKIEAYQEEDIFYVEIKRIGLLKLGQLYKACNKNNEGIYYLEESLEYDRYGSFSYISTKQSILQANSQLIRDAQLNPELEHDIDEKYNLNNLIDEANLLLNQIKKLYYDKIDSKKYVDNLTTAYHDLATLYYYNCNYIAALVNIISCLKLKFEFCNEESILGSLLLQYSINEELEKGDAIEKLSEIIKILDKIENPKKEIDGYYNVAQHLLNQSKYEEAEYFFVNTYHKLINFRKITSITHDIKSNITNRYYRLGFTWAISRFYSNDYSIISDVWDVLERSLNIELSNQLENFEPDVEHELERLKILTNFQKCKIFIIGIISDFVPNAQSIVLKLTMSNIQEINHINLSNLNDFTHTDISYITDKIKINEINNLEDFENRLDSISQDVFSNLFDQSFDQISFFNEIDNIILLPYGRLQKLPLEELLNRYLLQNKIKYSGIIVRAASIISYNNSLENINNNSKEKFQAIIVDNPNGDPNLNVSECENIRDIFNNHSISINNFDESNAFKNDIFKTINECYERGIIYHHSSHGIFPRDPTLQSIEVKDGWLSMNDFLEIPIRLAKPSLVSLSTCQSGTLQNGISSELLGIPMSLISLGFNTIIASLYEVDIQVAKQFFEQFYKLLFEGNNSGEAFQASIELLKKDLSKRNNLWDFISIISWHHIGPPFYVH